MYISWGQFSSLFLISLWISNLHLPRIIENQKKKGNEIVCTKFLANKIKMEGLLLLCPSTHLVGPCELISQHSSQGHTQIDFHTVTLHDFFFHYLPPPKVFFSWKVIHIKIVSFALVISDKSENKFICSWVWERLRAEYQFSPWQLLAACRQTVLVVTALGNSRHSVDWDQEYY